MAEGGSNREEFKQELEEKLSAPPRGKNPFPSNENEPEEGRRLPEKQWKELLSQEELLLTKLNLLTLLREEYKELLPKDVKLIQLLDSLSLLSKQLLLSSLNHPGEFSFQKFSEQVDFIYQIIVSSEPATTSYSSAAVTSSVVFETTFGASVAIIKSLFPYCNESISKIGALKVSIIDYIKANSDDENKAQFVNELFLKLKINNAATVTFYEFLTNIAILPVQHLSRYQLHFGEIIKNTVGCLPQIEKLEAICKRLVALANKINAMTDSEIKMNSVISRSASFRIAKTPQIINCFLAYTLFTADYFLTTRQDPYFKKLFRQAFKTVLTSNTPNIISNLAAEIEKDPEDSTIAQEWGPYKLWLKNILTPSFSEDTIALLRKSIIVEQSRRQDEVTIFEKGTEELYLYKIIISHCIGKLKLSPDYQADYFSSNKRKSIHPGKDFGSIARLSWSALSAKIQNKTLNIIKGLRIYAVIRSLEKLRDLNSREMNQLIDNIDFTFDKNIFSLIRKITWESLSFLGQPLPYEIQLQEFDAIFMLNNPSIKFERRQFVAPYIDAGLVQAESSIVNENPRTWALVNMLEIVRNVMRIHTSVIIDSSPKSALELWNILSQLFLVGDKVLEILRLMQPNPSAYSSLMQELNKTILALVSMDLKNYSEISWLQPGLEVLLKVAEDNASKETDAAILKRLPQYIKLSNQITPDVIILHTNRHLITRVYAYFFEYMLSVSVSDDLFFPNASIKERFVDHMCSILHVLYLLPLGNLQAIINMSEESSIFGLLKWIFSMFIDHPVKFKGIENSESIMEELRTINSIYKKNNMDIAAVNVRLTKLIERILGNTVIGANTGIAPSLCEFFILLSYAHEYRGRAKEINEDELATVLKSIYDYVGKFTLQPTQIQTAEFSKK